MDAGGLGQVLKPQGLVVRGGTGVPSAEFSWHQQWNWLTGQFSVLGSQGNL